MMAQKMTDRDIMIMLRDVGLMLERIAVETGEKIEIYAGADGKFTLARIGEYEFNAITTSDNRHEVYRYCQIGKGWTDIEPAQVRFGQEPLKCPRSNEKGARSMRKQQKMMDNGIIVNLQLVEEAEVEKAKEEMQRWFANGTSMGAAVSIGYELALRTLGLMEEGKDDDPG